jgi:hypothetical protein
MKALIGIGAAALGVLGTLACAAAIGVGWWTVTRITDRINLVAARLDHGFFEADAHLMRVENRQAGIQADLAESVAEAEKLAAENADLPRVRSAVERCLDRLLPKIDRLAEMADSLRAVATVLRAAEEFVGQVGRAIVGPGRAGAAADAIDRAAELLEVPRTRVDALKSSTAVRLTHGLVELARQGAAGSERLGEGLADARQGIAVARKGLGEYQTRFVHRVRIGGVAYTVGCVWVGLGQMCLIGWGRRRLAARVPCPANPTPAA